jgi:hypothetical protein
MPTDCGVSHECDREELSEKVMTRNRVDAPQEERKLFSFPNYYYYYYYIYAIFIIILLTYLLHGEESFLRS